jgi:hypothetical protein
LNFDYSVETLLKAGLLHKNIKLEYKFAQTFNQPAKVGPRIVSENNYVDSYGSLHIVGEVINESYESMEFVQLTATFYDASNGVVETSFDYTSPSTLQPGQRAPFDITASEGTMPTYLTASYTLCADHSDFD